MLRTLKLIFLTASALPLLLLSGASDALGQPAKTNAPSSQPGPLPLPVAYSNDSYVPDSKHKLRTGDRVSFQILEDRDAPKSLLVSDSGEVDIPYLGRMPVVDKTCKQLSAEIKTLLEKDFYYRATVVVALDVASRSLGHVYVWGQVKNQGPIELLLTENLTAGKAILRAGGFADFASRKRVKLIRTRSGDPASRQVFELNMVDILEDGRTDRDVPLLPEDAIIVPSRLINF